MKGILLPLLYCFGQAPAQQKQLSIGDKVPDFAFSNVMNHKYSNARLSEFKSKLVVLDIWSSWCSACIEKFPKVQSLQDKFKGKAQFLLVNMQSRKFHDDEAKIRGILNRVKNRTGVSINLPVIYNAEALDAAFPCREVPQLVWLVDGKVKAITRATELTEENIQSVIEGKHVSFKMKQDRFDVNSREPLFINGNGGDGEGTIYRSLLTKRIEGIGSHTGHRSEGNLVVGIYSWNNSLLSLIRNGFPNEMDVSRNMVFLDRKHLASMSPNDSDFQKLEEVYCYELIVPPTTYQLARQQFRQDLQRYFNASVKRETRLMKCLVLKKERDVNYRSGNQTASIELNENAIQKHIRNYPVNFIANLLNQYIPIPILNETGITQSIAIDLPHNIKDIEGLKKAFWEIGICVEEQERLIEVAVISFSNQNN